MNFFFSDDEMSQTRTSLAVPVDKWSPSTVEEPQLPARNSRFAFFAQRAMRRNHSLEEDDAAQDIEEEEIGDKDADEDKKKRRRKRRRRKDGLTFLLPLDPFQIRGNGKRVERIRTSGPIPKGSSCLFFVRQELRLSFFLPFSLSLGEGYFILRGVE